MNVRAQAASPVTTLRHSNPVTPTAQSVRTRTRKPWSRVAIAARPALTRATGTGSGKPPLPQRAASPDTIATDAPYRSPFRPTSANRASIIGSMNTGNKMNPKSTMTALIRLIAQPHGVPPRLARLARRPAARDAADRLNSQFETARYA
jgi:hypothetical protein